MELFYLVLAVLLFPLLIAGVIRLEHFLFRPRPSRREPAAP